MEDLSDQNVKAIGTKKMKTFKEMKKSDRGSFEFCSVNKVYFCRWNNNYLVNIGSNCSSHLPVETVKHRVKRDSNVSINQPHLKKEIQSWPGRCGCHGLLVRII